MRKKTNFSKLIQVWAIISLIGLGGSIVTIDVISDYHHFNFQANQMRADYIDNQKLIIKQEVSRVVEMIRFEKAQSESLARRTIKVRVYEAYAIAQNIYKQNPSESKATLQKMITDALRPIRFENGTGYFFATRLDGVEILFADKPKMEGLNLLGMQDTRGHYVIQDMIEIVKQSSEGFYEYHWTKPESTGDDFKKISFIKRFESYDWFIGAGLYVDDVERQIKANLLSSISRIRFAKEGYIFINRFNGDALVSNGNLFSGTQKLWEVFDDNPEKIKNIFEKEYKAALKPDGDYIYYSWIKLSTSDKELPKTSFIYGIPDLQWLVGAGVYLDEVETNIALMQTELNNEIKTKLFYFILTITGIIGLFFLFFIWLNSRFKKDFTFFISFFSKAASSEKEIDRTNIKFVELDQMAEYANRLLSARKQAKASARNFLENVINVIADPVFVKDGKRRFVLVNESLCAIVGRSRESLLGEDGDDMFPAEETAVFRKMDEIVLDTGKENVNEESLSNLSTGEVRTIVTRKTRYIDPNGNRFIVGVIRDITDRKQSEMALRESEEKYRLIAENITDVISTMDMNLRFTYVSPSVKRLRGFTVEEALAETIDQIMTPDSLQLVSRAFEEELRLEGTKTADPDRTRIMELEEYKKDGSVIWVEITPSFLRDKDQKPVGILIVSRDITARKHAEERVARFGRILEDSLNEIYLFDAETLKFNQVNRAAQKNLGYTMEELTRLTPIDIKPEFTAESFRKALSPLRNGEKESLVFETIHKRKDQSTYHVEVHFQLLKMEPKALYAAIILDITKRKQLENQLNQAHKMESIGTLAGGIAHDFNNILSSIIGFTELSMDEVEKGTLIEDNLQEVYTAGKRARDLVKQILAFARQSEEEVKPVQVDTIVKEVVKFIRSSIPTTIEIKQNVDSDSLIMGNATQVHQVLMNLLTNAAHAMEDKGGILDVSLKDVVSDRGDPGLKPGNYIELKVSDTGAGIAPEIIGSIFDPYFTTKGPGEGSGMGLAMVHGIIESYGGKITADSKPGQGSIFTVFLPITRKRRDHRPYIAQDLPAGTEKILFVDDEAPIAILGSRILERLGYSVTTRTSSVEALELFRSKPDEFDLIISDMTMPNLTGDQLAVEMLKIRPDISVIICTGYSKRISEESAAEIGIKGFAYKPVVKADLAKTVRKVLDEAKGKI